MTFEDVAVDMSWEEWKVLEEKRDSCTSVMLENGVLAASLAQFHDVPASRAALFPFPRSWSASHHHLSTLLPSWLSCIGAVGVRWAESLLISAWSPSAWDPDTCQGVTRDRSLAMTHRAYQANLHPGRATD